MRSTSPTSVQESPDEESPLQHVLPRISFQTQGANVVLNANISCRSCVADFGAYKIGRFASTTKRIVWLFVFHFPELDGWMDTNKQHLYDYAQTYALMRMEKASSKAYASEHFSKSKTRNTQHNRPKGGLLPPRSADKHPPRA